MADSPEAVLLKRRARRRLVGAVALVILAVVFLPVVLDQQPRTVTQPLTLKVPSLDDPGRGEARDDTSPSRMDAQDRFKASEASRAKSEGSADEGNIRSRAPDRQTARKEASAKATEAREVFVVPLGAFARADNAKQVLDKAASAGIKSYTETIRGPKGESTRVRAGPFAARDSAEKARQKLKAIGLEVGQVMQK